MKYVNPHTGFEVELGDLSEAEQEFCDRALEKFQRNVPWGTFDEFAFGMWSPIYSGKRSHRDVLTHPLYLALKDMSVQLGVQQGLIARSEIKQTSRA